MNNEDGRVPTAPGSHAPHEAPAGLRPTGFDPSRERAGRFAQWATADLAAQCRMQAREQLDPEFTEFMFAVADRLADRLAPEPCPYCLGTGWVCENHRDRPWDGHTDAPEACGCGAGTPCRACCDRDAAPRKAAGFEAEGQQPGPEGDRP